MGHTDRRWESIFMERRLPRPIRLLDESLLLAGTPKGPVPGAPPLKPRVHSIVLKADNRFYWT